MGRHTSSPPITRGERLLSALTYILILPLAVIVGGVEYLLLRRTRPFLARHGAQAALWQLSYLVLNTALEAAIFAIALRYGYTWPVLNEQLLALAQITPTDLLAHWPHLSLPMQVLLLTIACLNVVFIAGALWGADRALRGHTFQAPVIGRLFARTSSPHTV